MIKQRVSIRPALAAKLQEYLNRRKEFEQLVRLTHPYLKAAWLAGHHGPETSFDEWRDNFAKEENEKNKRSRSSQAT